MSDDLVKRADSFRLGASPTPDDVNEANWLIDRMSVRIEELEAKLAKAVGFLSSLDRHGVYTTDELEDLLAELTGGKYD